MKYYILQLTNNADTGPIFPQVQKMAPKYDYNSENSVYALSRYSTEFPNFTPNLDYFVLHSKSKLTDFLSVTVIYGGFLISAKVKSVLDAHTLPRHKYYSARIKHKESFYDNYYWLHIISDFTDQIDYPNSSFFIYQDFSKNVGPIIVNSKDDYIKKNKKLKELNPEKMVSIWSDNLALSASFDKSLDLFQIGSFNANCFISSKLRDAFKRQNITGCSIEETEIIRF